MPPATPATRRPDRRRCSAPAGGADTGAGEVGTGLVTLSSSHGPGGAPSGSAGRFLRVSPDVGARGPDQPESHERFGRAHHAAGDVGNPPRPAAGGPADRRRRRGDRAPLRHRSRARPGGFRRRGLLRHRRGALHRRLGAASRRARYRPGRVRPTAPQGVAADPARNRGRGRSRRDVALARRCAATDRGGRHAAVPAAPQPQRPGSRRLGRAPVGPARPARPAGRTGDDTEGSAIVHRPGTRSAPPPSPGTCPNPPRPRHPRRGPDRGSRP